MKANFQLAVWIIVFISCVTLWMHIANHRTNALNEYHDCVSEQMAGTSIPLQDAWVIFHDVCQTK